MVSFMDKKLKISSTAYRVLLLLSHLNKGECNVEYLNDVFSSDKLTSRYFSKEVILKYISTLRAAGYDISKPGQANNYKYELNKSPVLINLSTNQLKNLATMLYYAESLHQNKLIYNYNSFLKKIKKLLSEKQIAYLNRELKKQRENPDKIYFRHALYKKLIKKLEKFISENQRVTLKYKSLYSEQELKIVLELKSLKYEHAEVFLIGYNPIIDQTHSIRLGQILEIKQLPTKSQYSQVLSPVLFNLKGVMAKVYRPYENEKITQVNESQNLITVAAYVDDKTMLVKRLLKYGENCEVIYPKHVREEICQIINDAINNYQLK